MFLMEKNPNFRIRRSLQKNYIELHNISANKGIPFSLFAKQILTQIADSYPAEMKIKPIKKEEIKGELNINGVSGKTYNEILNICENLGVDISSFFKIESKKIAEGYSAKLKATPLDY